MISSVSRVVIGVIVGAHGIQGEVRVKPLTDFIERFQTTERVRLQSPDKQREKDVQVLQTRVHSRGMILARLQGINDRTAAEKLKKWELQVPRNEAVPLSEDSYYIFDLLQSRVCTGDGLELGRLVDVIQTGANDVYVVRGDGKKEVLIPALKQVVKHVDVYEKRIVVDLPQGLIDG